MGDVPQDPDLLGLTPGRKCLLLYSQRDELFEMLDGGITAAGLPPRDRFARDAQVGGQTHLCQAKLCTQRQDVLTGGVIALTIQGLVHERSSFLTQPGAVFECKRRQEVQYRLLYSDFPGHFGHYTPL
jgi:hypothetical protein